MPEVVIFGLGFTAQRLAARLLARGFGVYAAVRHPERFKTLVASGLQLCNFSSDEIPHNAVLIHSIPPLADPETLALHALIEKIDPHRVIYISSTGVYGSQTAVDAATPALPDDETGLRRFREEQWIARGPWLSLILRSAAIYGPGRGAHVRLREGKRPRGEGIVSRIHVDDLAALLEAAVFSDLQGAWPVADDEPCSTTEISKWCADLLKIDNPGVDAPRYPVSGRSVNGKQIRDLLFVTLRYPSYRTGIPASLAEEKTTPPEATR